MNLIDDPTLSTCSDSNCKLYFSLSSDIQSLRINNYRRFVFFSVMWFVKTMSRTASYTISTANAKHKYPLTLLTLQVNRSIYLETISINRTTSVHRSLLILWKSLLNHAFFQYRAVMLNGWRLRYANQFQSVAAQWLNIILDSSLGIRVAEKTSASFLTDRLSTYRCYIRGNEMRLTCFVRLSLRLSSFYLQIRYRPEILSTFSLVHYVLVRQLNIELFQ